MASTKTFDFRCPIHGFVTLDEWERDIVDHPVFQRLRRIKQLAWTDEVYPGASHTRFEHSLGVMHVATRLFDEIWSRRARELETLNFSQDAKKRERVILRLLALLHDVGHSPFSHAGEDLMATGPNGKPYKHEDYSAALIRSMTDVIDDHHLNKRAHNVRADEVADVLEGKSKIGFPLLFWKQLMSSQLDADRADYLLRDSHHIGVQYGHYDLNRLAISLTIAENEGSPVLAVDHGGWHTAEALIVARYMMFSQVYFHKTRSIYDLHVTEALRTILQEAQAGSDLANPDKWPPPTAGTLAAYSAWDDWRVLGILQGGGGGEHGRILRERKHWRLAYELGGVEVVPGGATPLDRYKVQLERYEDVKKALGDLVAHEADAARSWYKLDGEILIARGVDGEPNKELIPLSEISPVVRALKKEQVKRLYVRPEEKDKAAAIVQSVIKQAPK